MNFYQDCGLNICMYGVGSKRNILNEYLNDVLRSGGHSVSVVNGYHSGCSIKNVI